MVFKEIYLRNYRNFSELSAQFSPRMNFFIGDNGQGKTNLLEAMYLFSDGDSFRYGDNAVLIKNGENESYLRLLAVSKGLQYELTGQIQKSKKTFFANEKKITGAELRKRFTSILFSPESLASIKEGADYRRDLVDNLLVSIEPTNADLLSEYKRALKTRNKIFKDHLDGLSPKNETLALLESLEPSFLRLATQVTMARMAALKAILPEFNAAMQDISCEKSVDISVEYVISGQNALEKSLEEVDAILHKRLMELRDAEVATGASLVGPQKHDIIFLYGQKDSRFYCSQGQQRAIILSFKMAQIVYHRRVHGFYPALMLDDVLSELDEGKKSALINFLHEINTQIFITSTDLTLPRNFALENISVMTVKNGALTN
jgi:DNA replication and repair protein RecF